MRKRRETEERQRGEGERDLKQNSEFFPVGCLYGGCVSRSIFELSWYLVDILGQISEFLKIVTEDVIFFRGVHVFVNRLEAVTSGACAGQKIVSIVGHAIF